MLNLVAHTPGQICCMPPSFQRPWWQGFFAKGDESQQSWHHAGAPDNELNQLPASCCARAEGMKCHTLQRAAGQETSVNVCRDWPALIPFTRLQRGLPYKVQSEGRRGLSQAVAAWARPRPVDTRGLQGNLEVVYACLMNPQDQWLDNCHLPEVRVGYRKLWSLQETSVEQVSPRSRQFTVWSVGPGITRERPCGHEGLGADAWPSPAGCVLGLWEWTK